MKRLSTALADRELRFDGVSIVDPERVGKMLLSGLEPSQIRVTHIDEGTEMFNRQVDIKDELRLPNDPVKLPMDWQVPPRYMQMDLWAHIQQVWNRRVIELNYGSITAVPAKARLEAEYAEIVKRGMLEFFKTIVYILDRFREEGVVWGVGRGSSCACYILFILGLHSVDCVKYEIPMTEFFHD